ncbi:MAG: PAS domain-containing protein, partial [Deltaproteobacteria bacterium]
MNTPVSPGLLYQEVVENSNSFILLWNEDGITYVNRRTCGFFGYEQQELLGKDVSILVPSRESTGRNLERLTDDILKEPE